MIALRLHPGGELRLHDEPPAQARPDETLLQVAAVGLCGSDRHWLLEGGIGDARVDRPLILGHEFSGVALSGSAEGRLLAADPTITCQHCPACTGGRENLCLEQRFAGYSGTDGALREQMGWPTRLLYPVADGLSPAEAALVEPLAIALHALELAGEVGGRELGVVGCGPIGLLIVTLALAAGARRVVAVEPLAQRLAAAVERGAQPISASDVEQARLEVVFEVAGEDDALDTCLRLAAPAASVLLVGIPAQDRTSFVASVARRKGLSLQAVRRSTGRTFAQAASLAGADWLRLPELISHRLPLEETEQAFALLVAREGIKVIIEVGGGRA